MSDRVDLEVIDYSAGPRKQGPFDVFLSVPGERDEDGKKRFREIIRGPSIRAIIDDIGPDLGTTDSLPVPTHVHGMPVSDDLYLAVMAASNRWM